MRNRCPYAWPDRIVALLKEMHADGYSCAVIAARINAAEGETVVTRNAVIGKLGRLGITNRKLGVRRPQNLSRAQRERKSGVSYFAKAPRFPRAKPTPTVPDEPGPTAIPFSQRTKFQCAWIFDTPHADALCCGRFIETYDYSFCPAHRARATQKVRVVMERPVSKGRAA